MGFLRTNDLSEVKNGEFCLDFKVFGKNRGVGDLKIKNKISKEKFYNRIPCSVRSLKLGFWGN